MPHISLKIGEKKKYSEKEGVAELESQNYLLHDIITSYSTL